MASTPAGWYDDPGNPGAAWRFFDGSVWTDLVEPDADGHKPGAVARTFTRQEVAAFTMERGLVE